MEDVFDLSRNAVFGSEDKEEWVPRELEEIVSVNLKKSKLWTQISSRNGVWQVVAGMFPKGSAI